MSETGQYFLIIQTAFLGDVALALCMPEYLKQRVPDCRVTFLTTKIAAPIVRCCPFVDQVDIYDKRGDDAGIGGLLRVADRLKKILFDAVFTPHRSFRSSVLSLLLRKKAVYVFDKNTGSWLFKNRVHYQQSDHEIIRDLKLVRAHFGDVSDEVILPTVKFQNKKNGGPIALAPGSVWHTKRWPVQKWIELIKYSKFSDEKFVLIGGPNDAVFADEIFAATQKHVQIENWVGTEKLPESLERISKCKLLISNDSGPTHFALATRTPVITIFGSTIPAFGFAPIGEFGQVVETTEQLNCRPCGIHGKRVCPEQHFRCMESISVEMVVEKIK